MLCGKQGASSKYCCPYCTSCSPWTEKTELTTVGKLWDSYTAFIQSGSEKKFAKNFDNVVSRPLLIGDQDSSVLSLLHFPELHVTLGVVGKLVKGIEATCFSTADEGTEFMNSWMNTVNVSKTVYHGGTSFVGDMAKRLLNNLYSLEHRVNEKLDKQTQDKILPFLTALKCFNGVRVTCFGQIVLEGYKESVDSFSKAYRVLNISVPLKVHLIEAHLIDYLQMKGGEKGAGFYSEQAMESCHHDFKTEWEPVKVREADKSFGTKLMSTIVRYNGKHI